MYHGEPPIQDDLKLRELLLLMLCTLSELTRERDGLNPTQGAPKFAVPLTAEKIPTTTPAEINTHVLLFDWAGTKF